MKQFIVIDPLLLDTNGVLVCKKPSRRSFQKAHFKQGDLDGACGAYSILMVLNILGVFEAEELNSNTEFDKRTAEWKLIQSLNEKGLYRDGLTSKDIQNILTANYAKYVTVQCVDKEKDIMDVIKNWVDSNNPVVLGIDYNSTDGHWVVVVGYVLDEEGEPSDLLILDPGNDSPKYCLWNGILNVKKEPRKKYGFRYNSDRLYMVDIGEVVIIAKKK